MYRIELNGKVIGETQLESADPPMGVVRGKMTFKIEDDPYLLIKTHCQIHGIHINQDEEELGLIDTQNIASLKVFRIDGVEITDVTGASISGFRDDGYEITLL
jgi:hypothetical protein